VYRDAVNAAAVDAGMHAVADSLHIYIFRLGGVPA
jgi:hypothetical protein